MRSVARSSLSVVVALLGIAPAYGQSPKPKPAAPPSALDALHQRIDRQVEQVLPRVVTWRRDFHQHPELGNREIRTSKIVADHLRALGYEVRTGVAKTGVVGVLRGGKPGPVVALRSDMDALPVTEELDLPFKSTVKADYNGREVGVMHACGHDFHMSMLMGAAEILASMRADLPGTVKIIFQPAEEGAPSGEDGGADVMVREGVLDNPKVDAIFGLHVGVTPLEAGSISFRPGGIMAASDTFTILVRGRQTHGAMPWAGVDPIVVSSQIVLGLQTIISRQSNLTTAPAILTVGVIEGGNRFNIVPEQVRMAGTIRTFDPGMQKLIHELDQAHRGADRPERRRHRRGDDHDRKPRDVERSRADREDDAVPAARRRRDVQSQRPGHDGRGGFLLVSEERAWPVLLPWRGAEGFGSERVGGQPFATLRAGRIRPRDRRPRARIGGRGLSCRGVALRRAAIRPRPGPAPGRASRDRESGRARAARCLLR